MSKDWSSPVTSKNIILGQFAYILCETWNKLVCHHTRKVGISFRRDLLSFSFNLVSFERAMLLLLKTLFERVVDSSGSSPCKSPKESIVLRRELDDGLQL